MLQQPGVVAGRSVRDHLQFPSLSSARAMSAALKRLSSITAVVIICAVASACDKDPTQPSGVLALVQCPSGVQLVNAPVTLSFSLPLSPSSVTGANIVVTDAATGFEIPGSVRLDAADARTVIFQPAQPLPFDTLVRVRVQNLLSADAATSSNVTVCELRTELPPIRELYWQALPGVGGNYLNGVSVLANDFGYAMSNANRLFRYSDTSTVTTLPLPPYYTSSNDVSFVTRTHGFATATNVRVRKSVVLETFDGGVTFDTIGTAPAQVLNRAYFRPLPNEAEPFGVAAGGQTFSPAYFMKYHPATHTFSATSFGGTGGVNDLDFTPDTLLGAAATLGLKVGSSAVFGTVFVTTDGGTTWSAVAGARAPDSVVTYRGIAVRGNGEIWVTGGNGYVAKLTPSAGSYTITRVVLPGVTNPTPDDPSGLIYNDVQFAPGQDQLGWIVGSRQVGAVGGVPRYEGLIFVTRDGGGTWIRQGVRGGANYGAEFPALNRLDVLSPTVAWIVGEAGTVLRYQGASAQ
jgi:Big-like domain-containing protein